MRKGFSLLETTVVVGLGTILTVLMLSAFNLSLKSLSAGDQKAEFTQNAIMVFDALGRELRQAKTVVSSLPAANIEFENGHNPFPISYIYYYLGGSEVKREERRYFFPSNPEVNVKKTDRDSFGNSPESEILKTDIKAEYFKSLNFSMSGDLIIMEAKVGKDKGISFRTKISGRNL